MRKQKVKLKCSELADVDVDLISLVHRPASRVPFGIMKSDAQGGTMRAFDLGQLFVAKSEAATPVVTSVIVNGETSERMLELLKGEGFSVEDAETNDGVTVYKQETVYNGAVSVVKLTDNVAITVPVIKGEGSFAEMCAARGFYPSISIATELLQCELYRAVEKSDSPSAAAEKVRSVTSDFGNFMGQLVGGLPSMVFKAEQAVAKAEIIVAPETEATVIEGQNDDRPAHEGNNPILDHSALAEAPVDAAPPAEAAATNPGNANEEVAAAVSGETVQTHVAKGDEEEDTGVDGVTEAKPAIDIAAIVKAALDEKLAPLSDTIATVKDGLGAVTDRLNTVEQGVQKAEKAVFGGVFGTSHDEPEEVEKSDREPRIDTGFNFRG